MRRIDKRSREWREMSDEDKSNYELELAKHQKENPTKVVRKKRGGARPGSGRKPKIEEVALIERLDNIIESDEVIRQLEKLAMGYTITKTDVNGEEYEIEIQPNLKAIQLYLNYRYGKPKESKDISISKELPLFQINLDDVIDIEGEEV